MQGNIKWRSDDYDQAQDLEDSPLPGFISTPDRFSANLDSRRHRSLEKMRLSLSDSCNVPLAHLFSFVNSEVTDCRLRICNVYMYIDQ